MTDSMNAVDPKELAMPELVTFKSRDGLEIEAWLWKPASMTSGKRYPAFVRIHGGPTIMSRNNCSAVEQYFMKKGYVFLAPNFRGSTNKDVMFKNFNGADWGGGDLDDVVWAAKMVAATRLHRSPTDRRLGGQLWWLSGSTVSGALPRDLQGRNRLERCRRPFPLRPERFRAIPV